MTFLAKIAALVSAKAAIGLTAGVLTVAAAGIAGEATITGSTNPSNWGQQVVQQVQKCKAALAPDSHGIGQCVSTFAKQHGQQVSSERRASGARTNTPGHSNNPGNSNNSGNSNHPGQSNHSTDHPSGPPTDHTTGQPTNHPGGKPSSNPGQGQS